MQTLIKNAMTLGACFGLLMLVNLPQAEAAFQLRLSAGVGNEVTITDQDFLSPLYAGTGVANAPDFGPLPGQITFSGNIGAFTINVTTGIGSPVLPNTPYVANIHLNNISVSSAVGGTLTLELTQTGLTLAPSPGAIELRSTFGGVLSANATIEGWQILDLGDAAFATPGMGEAVVHHTLITNSSTTDPMAFSTNGFDVAAPYSGASFSLSEKVVITHAGAGLTSFDIDSLAIVPVPGTAILCLTGLPMFFGVRLVRRRMTKLAA